MPLVDVEAWGQKMVIIVAVTNRDRVGSHIQQETISARICVGAEGLGIFALP
jgi:hypothetical protein